MKETPEVGQKEGNPPAEGLEGSLNLRIQARSKTWGLDPLESAVCRELGKTQEGLKSSRGKGQKLLVDCFILLLSLAQRLPGVALGPLL